MQLERPFKTMIFTVLPFDGLGCGIKANCSHVRPGPAWGMPSVEVFLRDPSPYLL